MRAGEEITRSLQLQPSTCINPARVGIMSPSGGGGGVLHLADSTQSSGTDGGPTGVSVLVLLAASHVTKP